MVFLWKLIGFEAFLKKGYQDVYNIQQNLDFCVTNIGSFKHNFEIEIKVGIKRTKLINMSCARMLELWECIYF